MITDQLNIFTDNIAVKATANSTAVSVMPLLGKGDPVNVAVCVTEAYPGTGTVKVTVEESANGTAFTALSSFDIPSAKLTKAGSVVNFNLPANLRAKFVRLAYTVGGTPATGKLWAGVTRDALEPMEAGQFIKAGKKVL